MTYRGDLIRWGVCNIGRLEEVAEIRDFRFHDLDFVASASRHERRELNQLSGWKSREWWIATAKFGR